MTDAKEYARAIFELCEESGRTEAVLGDLKLISAAFAENPEYKKLLDTPAVKKEEKLALIDGAFSSLDEYALNLVKILCERHAVHLFPSVCDSAHALYDEARGILRVEAITAVPMTKAQKEALSKKLEATTAKQTVINNRIDSSLLGGVVLRYSGIQLDGSVKTRLDEFRKSLSNIVM